MASNYIFVKAGLQALLKLRTDLYAYLQSLSLNIMTPAVRAIRVFALPTIRSRSRRSTTRALPISLARSLRCRDLRRDVRIDWQLTLLSLAVVPASWRRFTFSPIAFERESTSIQEQDSALLAQAQEGLSAVRMVHAFGREEWEVHQFHLQAQQESSREPRLTLTNVNSALVISTLMVMGTAAMYYLGTLHVLAGTLTLGSLLVFSAYLLMLYQPLESLTYTAWAMEGATAGAKRCFEVLDREDDVVDAPDARKLPRRRARSAFEGSASVTQPVSRSCTNRFIDRTESNRALVGGTGAGKSTLLSLVPRFYDPNQGSVTLDGRDLRQITKKSLRAKIAIVLQDTLLFSTTIRENIAYGRPDATDDEIREAAQRAQADEFISRLPAGYESPVGERGGHLSVGQRQRIGIARAFLKNAPILLLDEPTSALDPTTEAAIMETIKDLMQGRTTSYCHASPRHHSRSGSDRRARAWPDRRARHGRGSARRNAAFTPRCTPPEIILRQPQ